jgi:hypothetical protein
MRLTTVNLAFPICSLISPVLGLLASCTTHGSRAMVILPNLGKPAPARRRRCRQLSRLLADVRPPPVGQTAEHLLKFTASRNTR